MDKSVAFVDALLRQRCGEAAESLSILDVGTGNGVFLVALAKKGCVNSCFIPYHSFSDVHATPAQTTRVYSPAASVSSTGRSPPMLFKPS